MRQINPAFFRRRYEKCELPAVISIERGAMGYLLELPKVTSPIFRETKLADKMFTFDDRFDYGDDGSQCGGLGLAADCQLAGEILGHLFDVNYRHCAEYWGIAYARGKTLGGHQVYYDLGSGLAGGQINCVAELSMMDINCLLCVVGNRLTESVGVITRYELLVPLGVHEFLGTRLNRSSTWSEGDKASDLGGNNFSNR